MAKKSIGIMNKTELKAACDAQGIPYPEDAKNKELQALLRQAKVKKDLPCLESSSEPPKIPTRKMLLLERDQGKINIKINAEPQEMTLQGRSEKQWQVICVVTNKGGNVRIRPNVFDALRLMRGDKVLEQVDVDQRAAGDTE